MLRVRDLRNAIGRLTEIATQAACLDGPTVREAVLARGEATAFAYGRGVMLPHAAVKGLPEPMGVFARLRPALELDAPDDRPVDLALLILCPEGDEATLLRALSQAARRLRDRVVADRVRSADGAEAIHSVLATDVWREGPGAAEPSGRQEPEKAWS